MNNYPASEKAFLGLNHAQVFVYVLMTVISILFLFITNAYLFRMNFQDWSPVPIPSLLWFNTICLVLASVGMAWSKSGAKASDHQKTKVGLAMAGVFVVAFVSGQTWAWQELNSSGYFLSSNPANTFFFNKVACFQLGGLLLGLWLPLKFSKGMQRCFNRNQSAYWVHTGTTCYWSGACCSRC